MTSTRYRLAVIVLCAACLLRGADTPARNEPLKFEVTHTERVDFPAGGVLRMKNSTGELTVKGWDRSDVEITTIKSMKNDYFPQERAKAALDRVRITVERKGEDLVVTTDFPRRLTFPGISKLHGAATTFDLEYRIRAPRNARLVVEHNEGEVHVEDLAGNIQVRSHQGEITVHLPGDGPRAINAHSAVGSVTSDFPGKEIRHLLFGHDFVEENSATTQKLDLRIGYGDIVLLRMRDPLLPTPATP